MLSRGRDGVLKPISRRNLIRKLKNLGFAGPLPGGRHQYMKRENIRVIIPNVHSKEDIGVSLLRIILRQATIGEDDFNNA